MLRTKYWDFYSGLIEPGGVLEKTSVKRWRVKADVWGCVMSVSTFPTMPVKVAVVNGWGGMGGADDGAENKVLFGLTTPAGRMYGF